MSLYGLALYSLVYALCVASPGPGVAAVVARSLTHGGRGAPAFIAGFLVGDLVWLTVAATGLAAIAQSAQMVFAAVKYAGAAYLLFLAWRMWHASTGVRSEPAPGVADTSEDAAPGDARSGSAARPPEEKRWRAFLASLSLTLGNPKTMVFFLALLPTVVHLEDLTLAGFIEIAALSAVILPTVLGAYVVAAVRARRMLQSARAVRLVNRGSATVMAGAALAVARS